MKTIPVDVIFDDLFEPFGLPSDIIAHRFQVIECDGAYIVIQDSISKPLRDKRVFKAFLSKHSAFEYLKDLGIDIESEDAPREQDGDENE